MESRLDFLATNFTLCSARFRQCRSIADPAISDDEVVGASS
jgi:hypothetical protein